MGRILQIICGVVLAAGLLGSGQTPHSQGVAGPAPAIEANPQNAARHSEGDPTPTPTPVQVIIVETPEQAVHNTERERSSDSHDAADLEAQNRAADATEEQIGPALAAAILSFIGTGLVAGAVWVSVLDLRDSRRHTRIATRAYVVCHADPIGPVVANKTLTWTVQLVNMGGTPVRSVCHMSVLYIVDNPILDDPDEMTYPAHNDTEAGFKGGDDFGRTLTLAVTRQNPQAHHA